MAETSLTTKSGERAIRSARIKLSILSSTLRLSGNRTFNYLHVEDICKDAGISKVTFFKYFPQKEDVLLYYLRVWSFNRSVELHEKPRKGIKAVYFLFDRIADTFEKHPGLLLSAVSYLISDNRPPQPIPLKTMEKRILVRGRKHESEIDVLTIPQMLEHFLLDALMDREIQQVSDSRDLANLFVSLLYGTLVAAHVQQVSPLRMMLRKQLDMTLKGLQGPKRNYYS